MTWATKSSKSVINSFGNCVFLSVSTTARVFHRISNIVLIVKDSQKVSTGDRVEEGFRQAAPDGYFYLICLVFLAGNLIPQPVNLMPVFTEPGLN